MSCFDTDLDTKETKDLRLVCSGPRKSSVHSSEQLVLRLFGLRDGRLFVLGKQEIA